MEDISSKNNSVKRAKKKKATINESLNSKKLANNRLSSHKRSNSEHIKKNPSKSLLEPGTIINLITKGPSINKLFFKNDNISLKSGSMPKANKKAVKKFRSINIDKGKNEIYNNIMIKKQLDRKYDSIKNNNPTLNYYNMDYIEKLYNLKGVAKDFISNNNMKKSRKPNYINKNSISNDKLTFNNILAEHPIFEFYSPLKEKERIKKPLQKIQSVNQEKREYKFSDFKVIKNAQKEEKIENDDESLENINPDDFREGNNIQLIEGSSFSEENDESSSLSSENNDEKKEENKNKNKKKDKLSNLVNKSMKNNEKQKIERWPSQNYSDIDDNYFINETKIFMSPRINSNHPSNKSLKSDGKSDCFNNLVNYFNEATNNNDSLNKNSIINKSKIRKIESIMTNSNFDYEAENEEGYDLVDIGNKIVSNLNINDSYTNIKSNDISLNNLNNNNHINNDNNYINNIHTIKNVNINENVDNSNNNIFNNYKNNVGNKNYVGNNNKNKVPINKPMNNNRYINDFNDNFNNINSNLLNRNDINEFKLRNYMGKVNQSNIINIHNMNNFNNNNFIISNDNSRLNPNQINSNYNNSMNNFINNNINFPQNNIFNEQSSYVVNNNNFYDGNNQINNANFNTKNYGMNKNDQINQLQLNQLNQHNNFINENNNQYINNDLNNITNRFILNNSNFFNSNINGNISNNMNLNNNINNITNINNNVNKLYNKNNNIYLQNGRDVQNNNLNLNSNLNYNNSNKYLNNEINTPIFSGNNQLVYNQMQQQMNYSNINNNYQNQKAINQNMMNLSNSNINNNQNYLNLLQYNSYLNQINNINCLNNLNNFNNNININNNMNLYSDINGVNNQIIQKNNINVNNPNYNNIRYNDNYNMIHSIGNLNNIILENNSGVGTISNKHHNHSLNKQKKQNLNLLTNEELAKQAYTLAKYQNGCRYLQKRIENNHELVPTLFFPSILGYLQELSNDQFGNYYIKIIIKYLPDDMINKFIQLIHPSISKIGTNQYGTKVLQYLIYFLTTEKNLILFIQKILEHIVTLINDLNGIHIVQKLISVQSGYIQLIYNKIYENIQLIAVTRDGSNFIKKMIEFLDEKNMPLLINSINANLDTIITNQSGNYIIQSIIKKEDFVLKYQIIETIIKNIVNFSNQKFSSNVVEKCFEVEEMKDKAIDEIMKGNNFEQILLNEYGNYVIQKALFKSDQNRQHFMFKLFVPLITKLQSLPFGQKLLSKLFILYPRLSIYILNSDEQM